MLNDFTIDLLNEKFEKYNQIDFIADDPICIPKQYSKKQDIEIAGFFAATFAWGQRKTIIAKSNELLKLMDNSPTDFVLNASNSELKSLENFKHRTFNYTDLLVFIEFFKNHYQINNSLESAFWRLPEKNLRENLIEFNRYFFSNADFPTRTKKHLSTPAKHSACKRINMFLRWMVRKDLANVDFGIWKLINAKDLIIPCDIHVETSARKLGLTLQTKVGWKMAEEITNNLKLLDASDPVKYDFALFGLGIEKYFSKFHEN